MDAAIVSPEKFVFCIVISINTVLVVCVPSAAVVVVVVGVGSAAGCAFFRWKAPSAELPNADPNMLAALLPLVGTEAG